MTRKKAKRVRKPKSLLRSIRENAAPKDEKAIALLLMRSAIMQAQGKLIEAYGILERSLESRKAER